MIEILKDKDQWNNFVKNGANPGFTYFYEWMEVWQNAMRMEIFPLADLENEEIKSIFPLVYDRGSKMFFSQPFGGIGGVSGAAAYDAYLKFIDNLAREKQSIGIEINLPRDCGSDIYFRKNGYDTNLLTTDFLFDISSYKNFDDILMNKIGPRRRRSYRVALQKILIKKHETSREVIQKIHSFYQETLKHKKENQVFPIEVFLNIFDRFKDNLVLFLAELDGKFIGGAINLVFNDTVTPWFIVSLPEFRNTSINNGLYGEIIRWAKENNFKYIDWGASLPYAKEAEIKRGFGGEPVGRVRAIKMFTPCGKIKLFIKSGIFILMNKFPILWKLYR